MHSLSQGLFLELLFKSSHILETITACFNVHAVGSNLEAIPHSREGRVYVTAPDGPSKNTAAAAEHMLKVCVTCTLACDTHERTKGPCQGDEADIAGVRGQRYSF